MRFRSGGNDGGGQALEVQGEAFEVLDLSTSFQAHLHVAAFQSNFHYLVFSRFTISATRNLELRKAGPGSSVCNSRSAAPKMLSRVDRRNYRRSCIINDNILRRNALAT